MENPFFLLVFRGPQIFFGTEGHILSSYYAAKAHISLFPYSGVEMENIHPCTTHADDDSEVETCTAKIKLARQGVKIFDITCLTRD